MRRGFGYGFGRPARKGLYADFAFAADFKASMYRDAAGDKTDPTLLSGYSYTRSGAKSEIKPQTYGPNLAFNGYAPVASPPVVVTNTSATGYTAASVGATDGRAYLDIPTVIGKTYSVFFNMSAILTNCSGTFYARNGTIGNGTIILTGPTLATTGLKSATFTATGTTTDLLWAMTGVGAGVSWTVDNIVVQEVLPTVQNFAANVPGIVPGVGYWSRAAYTNLLTYSQTFDNANWPKPSATATADAALSPDGTMTADKLVDATAFASSKQMAQQTATVTASTTYTASVFVKAAEYGFVEFQLVDAVTPANFNKYPVINLSNGTVAAANGTTLGTDLFITPVGSGWYRLSIVAALGASTTSLQLALGGRPVGTNGTYTGVIGSGIYLWQGQLVQASDPGPIIVTTTAAASVGADALQMAPPITADQDFVIGAVVNFPDATSTGRLVAFNDGSSANRIFVAREVGGGGSIQWSVASVNGAVYTATPTAAAGRFKIIARRRAGKWSVVAANPAGTTAVTAETASGFPTGLIRIEAGAERGTSQPNSPVEFVGIRKGTFSDADLTAMLAAL